jgi:large subunit ribosomal protein L29
MAKTAKKEKKAPKAKAGGLLHVADIRSMSPDQLKDQLLAFRKEQFNARFQKLAGENAKPSRTRTIRKNIARIKTILNQTKVKESKNA